MQKLKRSTPAIPALTALLMVAQSACAGHTLLAQADRTAIAKNFEKQVVTLKQSAYVGDLYDENELRLLSPHAFSGLVHILDLDGNPIRPGKADDIVPAGTAMEILRVEFPDPIAMARRMVLTPRYNIWVYLRPTIPTGEHRPRWALDPRPMIWVLPLGMPDRAAVAHEISEALDTSGEFAAWLEKRRPTVRTAIAHKEVAVGMSVEEVVAALGPPQKRFVETQTDQDRGMDVFWYSDKEVWFGANGSTVNGDEGAGLAVQRVEAPRQVQQDNPAGKATPAPAPKKTKVPATLAYR